MKKHILTAALATSSAALFSISLAHAAVTVLGSGLAENCYQEAEFGGDPSAGVETCTFALDQTALSIRDRAATYINRGILRARAGSDSDALSDYDAGLALDGDLAEGYVDRGATLIALKRFDEAYAAINKGIDMGVKRPHIAYYDRAIADEALGNIRGAYEDYKKAVELEPDFTLATEQLTRFKVVRKPADGS